MYTLDITTNKHVSMVLKGKYACITGTDDGEAITQFINQRYSNSIRFHLCEQKAFLSNVAIAMRKSLSEQMIRQINRM